MFTNPTLLKHQTAEYYSGQLVNRQNHIPGLRSGGIEPKIILQISFAVLQSAPAVLQNGLADLQYRKTI
jgi:hypothetical protein